MLERVILNTFQGPKTFDILGVDPDEILIVKSISGLDAPQVSLFTGDYAGNGGYYQGRRFDKRNPVFTFEINPRYSVSLGDVNASQIRRMLYNYFLNPSPGSDRLKINLETTNLPDLYIEVNTEDIDTSMWEKDQTAMVSTVDVDPFMKSVLADSWSGAVNSGTFDYIGDVNVGIVATFAMGPNTYLNFQISGMDRPTQLMRVHHPTSEFVWGDVVTINTIEGQRSIKLNGVDKMSMLDTDVWPELELGNNVISCWGDSVGFTANSKLTSVDYRANWWGI